MENLAMILTFLGFLFFVGTFCEMVEKGTNNIKTEDLLYGFGGGGIMILIGFLLS